MRNSRRNENRWNGYTDNRHRRPQGSYESTENNGRGRGRARSGRPEFAPMEEEQRVGPRMRRRSFPEEYEPEFYNEAERRNAEAAFEKYGPEFYEDIVLRGGQNIRGEFDPEFYNEMNYRGVEAMNGEFAPETYRESYRRRSWDAPWNEYNPGYYDEPAYRSSQRHSSMPEYVQQPRLSRRGSRARLSHEFEHNGRTGSRSRSRGRRNH